MKSKWRDYSMQGGFPYSRYPPSSREILRRCRALWKSLSISCCHELYWCDENCLDLEILLFQKKLHTPFWKVKCFSVHALTENMYLSYKTLFRSFQSYIFGQRKSDGGCHFHGKTDRWEKPSCHRWNKRESELFKRSFCWGRLKPRGEFEAQYIQLAGILRIFRLHSFNEALSLLFDWHFGGGG